MIRATVAAVLCLLATGCAGEPDPFEGLEKIGPTTTGAMVYATRVEADRVRVVVMKDDLSWCNAAGPSNERRSSLCSDTFDIGSSYVATVAKDDRTWRVCDQDSGAGLAVERVATPESWDFDFIVGLTPETDVFGAPCSALDVG